MMRRGWLVLLLSIYSGVALAEKVYVVVNIENKEVIDREMIRNIYSDNRSHWSSGEEIIVFELPVKAEARQKFSQVILSKSAIISQRDWSNRFINNTIKNQMIIKPDRIVARFVSLKDNAIGYVPESIYKDSENLRIVLVIE
jgi:ABC-type phosphate transport system substrate-binding protein